MSFLSRLGRAAKAALEYHRPAEYRIRGDAVTCPVCGGTEFALVRDREVKRPLFSRQNIPWLELDRLSSTLICTHCTHLLSFGRVPERVEEEDGV